MKPIRISSSILPLVLAGLLLAGGCKKQAAPAEQPNSSTATASQPAVPPPPADQTAPGAAPETAQPAPGAAPAPAQPAPGAAPENAAAPAAPEMPPPPPPLVVPAGTHITVTVQQALGSKISQPGQSFTGTVARPILINGTTAIKSGASVSGTVVDAKPMGKFKGGALLSLRLDSVHALGSTYQISTNTLERTLKGKGKRSTGFIAGGTGGGALIGGLAGGGKGALIGGLVGAGAGTAGAAFTGNKQIEIPAETTLTFRLAHSVTINQ